MKDNLNVTGGMAKLTIEKYRKRKKFLTKELKNSEIGWVMKIKIKRNEINLNYIYF